MLLVKLDTGFNIEVEFAISPFHRRFFAWVIDTALQWIYIWLGVSMLTSITDAFSEGRYWLLVIFLLPYIFYHLVFETLFNGQSVGKMAMGIKVMTVQGGQPSISQYLIRWLFRIVDLPVLGIASIISSIINMWADPLNAIIGIFLLLGGLVCVIVTPKSQRIGDLVAGTILIDLKNRTSWQDTVFTEIESTYKPRYPQVMQLTDRDINTLKSIIQTVKKKNDYDLSLKIADRIKSKLKMDSDQDSLDFLETLLKDYNYYATN
jgi:uncharacterized RDD family membrane protein YckC